MKKLFCAFLIIFCFTEFVFSQSIPRIKKLVVPNYPVAAFAVSAEETFLAQIEINNEGKVVSVKSNAKRRFFHTVIEESLKDWIFDKSRKKSRKFENTVYFQIISFRINRQHFINIYFSEHLSNKRSGSETNRYAKLLISSIEKSKANPKSEI